MCTFREKELPVVICIEVGLRILFEIYKILIKYCNRKHMWFEVVVVS